MEIRFMYQNLTSKKQIFPILFYCLYILLSMSSLSLFSKALRIYHTYTMYVTATHSLLCEFPSTRVKSVKRVRIQSYSGPHFSRDFPHSDIRSPNSIRSISPYSARMRENARKMRTRIMSTFYAVMINSKGLILFELANSTKTEPHKPFLL